MKLSTALKEIGKGITKSRKEWTMDAEKWRQQVEGKLNRPPVLPSDFAPIRPRIMERQGEGSMGQKVWQGAQTLGHVCLFCGFKGHSAEGCWQKIFVETGIDKSEDSVKCDFCGLKGQTSSRCVFKKTKIDAKGKKSLWRLSFIKEEDEEKDDKSGPKASTSTNMVTQEPIMKTLMYVSINIQGVKFDQYLIDTGAAVNLIPLRAVKANQFYYSPGGIPEIRGFDGKEGTILGGMCSVISIGDFPKTRMAHFWVLPDISHPIISLTTLREYGMKVNCTQYCVEDANLGQTLMCASVTVPMKNKKRKN